MRARALIRPLADEGSPRPLAVACLACRELFYDDKRLFKSKAYSDSSIHLLCSILQVRKRIDERKGSLAHQRQLQRMRAPLMTVDAPCSVLIVQLQRDELSLVTSAKGLIMGNLQFEVSGWHARAPCPSAVAGISFLSCSGGHNASPTSLLCGADHDSARWTAGGLRRSRR